MIRFAASRQWLPAVAAAAISLLLLGLVHGRSVLAAGDPPAITVTSSAPTADFGTDVQFTAQVAGVDGPGTGTVTFTIDGVDVAAGVGLDTGTGSATFDTTTLSAGAHTVAVTYSGDGNYAPGSGALSPDQIIDDASTKTTLASSPHASESGQAVTFTATVSSAGGIPTGMVDFIDGGADLGVGTLDGSGTASITVALGLPLEHPITATYAGDPYFVGSTSTTLNQIILPALTQTVVTTTPSSVTGEGYDVTATVSVLPPGSGTALGGVTITDGTGATCGIPMLTVPTGSCTLVSTTAGPKTITATYAGFLSMTYGFLGPSTDTIVHLVNPAATTVSVTSSGPSLYGQSVTFTVTVASVAPGTGVPTGTVTLLDGATVLGTGPLFAPGRTYIWSPLYSLGTHSITAVYDSDGNYQGSTSPPYLQVVWPISTWTNVALTAGAEPSTFGGSVTFTASVVDFDSETPTGTVDFKDGALVIGSSPVDGSGQASFTTTALTAGPHSITAVYSGDADFYGSTSAPITQTVDQAVLAVTALDATRAYGEPDPPFTVSYSGFVNGESLATSGVTGSPACSSSAQPNSSPAGGPYVISCASGTLAAVDYSFNFVSGALTVTRATSTTALSSNRVSSTYGQSVTFTASVADGASGAPTGTVDFRDGSTVLGSSPLDGSGQASFTTTALAAGTHSITAVYSGDTDFNGSTSSAISQTVDKAALTVTAQDATRDYGAPNPAFTVGYSGFVNGENVNTAGLTGAPACTTTATPASTVSGGPYPITCTAGSLASNDYAFTFQPGGLTVTRATSTTIVTSNHDPSAFGQTVTFTATIGGFGGGSASGTVDFVIDGGAPQARPMSGGHATYTTAALTVGTHTVVADYNGDGNLVGSSGTLADEQAVGVSTFRLSGTDRYATGAAIVTGNYGDDSPFVYVATGANFPDGLTGAAAAAFRHSPLVLLDGQVASISPTVDAELKSVVGPDTHILVLGGTSSVSAHLYSALGGYGASTIARLQGADRYLTAIAVSVDAYHSAPVSRSVFVASGVAFPDALAAAGIAGLMGAPLILVPGNLANLNRFPQIITELTRLAPAHVYIAGGSSSVSRGIETQIADVLGVTPVRFAGANRYETATLMTDFFFGTVSGTPVAPFTSPPIDTVYVASGLNFPDALAGAALAGQHGAPLLLVPGTSPNVDGIVVNGHPVIRDELVELEPHLIIVFGASGAVSDGIFVELERIPRS